MFKLFKSSSGELRFTPLCSNESHFKDDYQSRYVHTIPIVSTKNKISYSDWINQYSEELEIIYENVMKSLFDVVHEEDIPIKLHINKELFQDLLYKKLYKTSYNSEKKWIGENIH